ncbi:Heavy-chain fibroin-like protein [Collimonas arenae]|uniref:Heavy-chain fibroin-like protein n=1 Tax=Collimonas arenae TaxID=279058 RepID=A0A0A1FE48_9BURK|nr:DUF3443 domain-containing protein [Collimonas arenae]AIY41929.1 Heavy-chain fibroin-like protein [Collimonas arenae]
MRSLTYLLCVLSSSILLACGGGGGDGGTPTPTPTPTPQPTQNVQAILIDSGPATASGQSGNAVNSPYVSVTICSPGSTSQCQTIDHILVDTGSSGLRIISSALSSSMTLPAQNAPSGNPLAECARFADGYSWGSVKQADLRIAGEVASNISVHIIGDSAFPSVPSGCSGSLVAENTVASFHANGLIGMSTFIQDCGSACAGQALEGWYYSCPGGTNCTATTLPVATQVANPVAAFPQDNNGTIIQLPSIGANGAAGVTGSLIFGIGTQANNKLGSANVYTLNSAGNLSVLYQGQVMQAFFDSGSNGLFFADSTIPACSNSSGFYCPLSTVTRNVTNTGLNGVSNIVSISIANANTLFQSNPNNTAFNNLGGGAAVASYFDWGLPFFFGRSVYTALEGTTVAGTAGPYVAY